MEIEPAAVWLLGDDTGSSSKALCAHMLGVESSYHPPWDAADRGRCVRLLRLIPEWIPRLKEMAIYEKPSDTLVIGASGINTEINSWAKQIPLIMEEGGLNEQI